MCMNTTLCIQYLPQIRTCLLVLVEITTSDSNHIKPFASLPHQSSVFRRSPNQSKISCSATSLAALLMAISIAKTTFQYKLWYLYGTQVVWFTCTKVSLMFHHSLYPKILRNANGILWKFTVSIEHQKYTHKMWQ